MSLSTRAIWSPPLAAATRWRLDSSASRVEFSVRQFWGLSTVHGHFPRFDGDLRLDAHGTGEADVRIQAASIRTGNRRRDRHLCAADFFDCEHHPLVRFVARVVPVAQGSFLLNGELEAAGRTVALELVASVEGGEDRLALTAAASLDARKLGMTWAPIGNWRTPVALSVCACLQRGV